MNRQFRLAGVLRVRRVQEDLARAEVAHAQAAARKAERDAEERAERLEDYELPDRAMALAFVAATSARTSLAMEASAARVVVGLAHDEVGTQLTQWQERAMRVDALETLEQRHFDDVRRADLAAEQHTCDDLAATSWRRRRLAGMPS